MSNPYLRTPSSSGARIGETWLSTPIAPGYRVSNHGGVATFWGDPVKPSFVADGIPYYTLHQGNEVIFDDAGWKLFLSAFYRNPPHDALPQYRTGSMLDLSMDNLGWVYFDGRVGYYKEFEEQRDWPMGAWRLSRRREGRVRIVETGEVFTNANQAAEHLGLNRSNISKVLAGTYRTAKGYTFERLG